MDSHRISGSVKHAQIFSRSNWPLYKISGDLLACTIAQKASMAVHGDSGCKMVTWMHDK